MDDKIQKSTQNKISVNIRSRGVSSRQLHIQNRTIADQVKTEEKIPTEIDTEPEKTTLPPTPIKHTVITPLNATGSPASVAHKSQRFMDTKFPVRKAITPSAPVAPTLPKPGENVVTTAPEPAAPELPTLKINEVAPAVDTKREHELDDMINSHKYYVPIDAIGRKRSIKVSILLTIVAVLLGLILVDFLLDAGSILLSHNVPHTHFFGSEKNT